MAKLCFMIGHRDTPECIKTKLGETIEQYINVYGMTAFLVGNHGRFDSMAARAVAEARKRHPNITLHLMLSRLPSPRFAMDSRVYDGTIFPEGMETAPPRLAVVRLNEIALKESDGLIAYAAHGWGGAAKVLEKARAIARKRPFIITNLAEHCKGAGEFET